LKNNDSGSVAAVRGASMPNAQPLLAAAIVVMLCAFVCAVIYWSADFPTPWGTDEIVYSWPIAEAMSQASLAGMLKLSTASFMAEDHMSPVFHFYTYLLTLFGSTPHTTINIATRIEYVVILASAVVAYRTLFAAGANTLLFAVLLVLNVPLLWTNALFPTFNLSIILSLWSLTALKRYIDTGRLGYLITLGGLSTLALLSFETGFAFLPLAAGYVVAHYAASGSIAPRRRLTAVAIIGGVLALSLVPYLVLHTWQYGIPLPASRTGEMADPVQYVLRAFIIFSEWNFGVFKLAYQISPYAAMGLGLAYITALLAAFKARLLKGQAIMLSVGLILQVMAIAYTGRVQSGMWSFAGIIYVMVVAEILAAAIARIRGGGQFPAQVALLLGLGGLFLATKEYVFEDAEWYNRMRFLDQTAAYEATGGPSDDFVLIQLPGARVQLHPVAFWYGNKVFNGQAPLTHYESINTMLYKNMYIQSFSNEQGKSFEFFEQGFYPSRSKRTAILTRDRNLFTRYFLDLDSDLVIRAAVIPYAAQDAYSLNLPAMDKYGAAPRPLRVVLRFADAGPAPVPSETAVSIDGASVQVAFTGPRQAEFTLENTRIRSSLVVTSGPARLHSIEVRRHSAGTPARATPETASQPRITAMDTPCRINGHSGRNPDLFSILATVDPGSEKGLDILFLNPEIFPLSMRQAPFTNDKTDVSVWRSFEWDYKSATTSRLEVCRN